MAVSASSLPGDWQGSMPAGCARAFGGERDGGGREVGMEGGGRDARRCRGLSAAGSAGGPRGRGSGALRAGERGSPLPLRLEGAVDVCGASAAVCCQVAGAAVAKVLQRRRKSSPFFFFCHLLACDTITAVSARTLLENDAAN